jgi:hypothetical protein
MFDRAQAVLEARYQGTFIDPGNQKTTATLLDRSRLALIP